MKLQQAKQTFLDLRRTDSWHKNLSQAAFRPSANLPSKALLSAAALLGVLLFPVARAGAQATGAGAAAAPAASSAAPATASQAPNSSGPPGLNNTVQTNPNARTDRTTQQNENQNQRDQQNERREDVFGGSQAGPTEFQQMVEATTGIRLPIFGASLFTGVPSTFAPVTDVPVGPGYILGPGDELNLQLSGQVDQQMNLVIDRTGAISVPGLGSVHVAGLPYGQLTSFLNQQLGKIYRNYTLNANLGSLRTIQVFVTGYARSPGSYTISSLSTLLNAIFASGGPLPQGSLRDIQVKRGSETIDHFDLYALLLHGDKTHDIQLSSGDVIFIPVVGPQVAVLGSVNQPAVYELNAPTTVDQALHLAGGESVVAASASVRLERIYEHQMRSMRDLTLVQANTDELRDGDILSVTSVIDRFRDAVTLRGNVANPGRYVWHPGMHVSDLIPNKESLITRNYWRQRNLLGQIAQDYQPDQSGNSTVAEGALQLHGNQTDRSTASTEATANTSSATNGGNSVGAALTANNSVFGAKTDVILSAPDIDWTYAVIERQSTTDLTTSLIPFNLGKLVLDGDPTQNVELLPGDVITIFSKADIRVPITQQTRYVRLEGEFISAGVYSVLPGETLRGLLRRVGGFTPNAYLYASEFTRESTRRVEEQRLHEYADELEAQISAVTASSEARALSPSDQMAATASAADANNAVGRLRNIQPIGRIVLDLKPDSQGIDAVPDISLEDGDRFVVPSVPANVTVEGQVYNANAFVYAPNQRALNYLRRAGGPDREADKRRTFILRADGSVVSRQYADVDKAPIYPGDTIVVPPVIDKRAFLQRIVDIAQIVGNLGIGAATLDILYHDQ